eukprot:CAMPEP_0113615718 /NCGR_PEP_ID=MMETSP0017_2-20120614/7855_1 /TAXON_ID=2856 /ORGANISM="Cylindrotheca closterium" /LENGTH=629 /DNA_ID=CAMNT_0000524983 /DNA_START=133 /DNA_END=2022 /DNA_ORIENTATION=- /assembly_acc=CAM_ASM_000147
MTSSRQPFSSPSLLAVIGTAALVLSSTANAANTNTNRSLQGQPYDYTSEHVVARASAISKDFQSIGGFLAQQNGADRQNARAMYQLGAYCQSFATLQLNTVLTEAIIQGATVTGTSESGATISGILHSDAFPGDATIEVMYLIPSDGITKICSVSGNPTPQYDQCFVTTGEITLPDGSTLGYTGYDLDNDTANGLSMQSMSSSISGAATQGYPRIGTFAAYYGTNKYADQFIQAAFDKVDTSLLTGNAEFSKFTQFGTNKFIEVATLTMSSWMHIIIKMQDAVEVCKSLPDGGKKVSEVPIWDNAVATYRGMGGAAGGTMGQLYHLANQYCAKFGTCQDGPGGTQGMAKANEKAYIHFNSGKQDLLDGKCDLAEVALDQAAVAMLIPLVQGLLYHAYELDLFKEQREVVQGEAAAFLHSVLPLVHSCSQGNAVMIYNQIKVGNGKMASFEAIKSSIEGQYECLGITCEDIGGIRDLSDPTTYQNRGFPCGAFNPGDTPSVGGGGDVIPDPAPIPVPAAPILVPTAPSPGQQPTPWPTQDEVPTSTPTDPPSSVYQLIEYDDATEDGVTYALAIGLPLLSVLAVAFVVFRTYMKKKDSGKEFDSGETDGASPDDETQDDLKVENLQGEML